MFIGLISRVSLDQKMGVCGHRQRLGHVADDGDRAMGDVLEDCTQRDGAPGLEGPKCLAESLALFWP